MKKTTNILLVIAVIIPIVLLFWPFAEWNVAMSLCWRIIPSISIQILLLRISKNNILKIIPVLFTGIIATWGVYLYLTSPHWNNATIGDLFIDYVSPFICCLIIFLIFTIIKKKNK